MMNRLVVYTCVTGAYDKLKPLTCRVPWADYVCFADGLESEGWDVRPVSWTASDPVSLSRYSKLNPHKVLPEYEYSLWIDGNVDILSDSVYETIRHMMDEDVLYGALSHPERDDVYDEALRIVANGRESLANAARTVSFLRGEGFPRHWGLYENNVILRKHNAPEVVAFDSLWWKMFSRFSRRDQLTCTYCMWKTDLTVFLLLPEGRCARNSSEFGYTFHGKQYVKDRSLKGRVIDARTAVKVFVFKLFLKLEGCGS